MIGPPAKPKRTGAEMPGIDSGTAPNARPKISPMKIDIRLGSLSSFEALPSFFSTRSIDGSSPTTITRSPSCSTRSGVANRGTPLR